MMALTLWQPWASLVSVGAKRVETRSWSVDYRGSLAIHASANADQLHLALVEPYRSALVAGGLDPARLPLGCVVATCFLSAVLPVDSGLPALSAQEVAFGDYSAGRYAWFLAELRRLLMPISAAGRQRLWRWDRGGYRAPHRHR